MLNKTTISKMRGPNMYSKLSHKLNDRRDLLLSLKEKGVYHVLRIITLY